MNVHLPIMCAYLIEGDVALTDPDTFEDTTCPACIAVAMTPPMTGHEGDDGRSIWAAASAERDRVRRALYALGFERTERVFNVRREVDKVQATYDEVFVGVQGGITLHWNQSPA